MSITYPDWTPPQGEMPEQPAPRTGMGALLLPRLGAEAPRDRWKSVAVSIAAHGAIAYVALFISFVALTPKEEVQTISVSIAAQDMAKPEAPPLPKLERLPDVSSTVPQIAPPQIEIAAPPPVQAIQAAPPAPPAPPPAERKVAEETPVTPPRFDAAYLNNAVTYPNMSRRLREVGTVQLRVRVSAAGLPLEIQMVKTSGYARLDEAAQTAVQKWKFQPAQRNGVTMEAWVLVPVEFSLTRS